jgi:DNA invertase Pin-like site-specific DNA recombinase
VLASKSSRGSARRSVKFMNEWPVLHSASASLVALDCAVDTTTPAGEAMANVLATFAQFERRLISQRTREALAVKRVQGVVLGRPPSVDDEVVRRIVRERGRGRSFRAIAESLNADGVPTGQGGKQWYAATVRTISLRAERPRSRRRAR